MSVEKLINLLIRMLSNFFPFNIFHCACVVPSFNRGPQNYGEGIIPEDLIESKNMTDNGKALPK